MCDSDLQGQWLTQYPRKSQNKDILTCQGHSQVRLRQPWTMITIYWELKWDYQGGWYSNSSQHYGAPVSTWQPCQRWYQNLICLDVSNNNDFLVDMFFAVVECLSNIQGLTHNLKYSTTNGHKWLWQWQSIQSPGMLTDCSKNLLHPICRGKVAY